MATRTRPPLWFRIVAAVLFLWGVIGVIGFHMSLNMAPETLAQLDDYDRRLYTERAGWFIAVYGLAVWAGLIGSLLLLFRRGLARPVYLVSLVAVLAMFGWMSLASDIIAVKGWVTATGFPIVIALIGVFEIWLANVAIRRGWIG